MKFVFLTGGFVGYAAVGLAGLWAGHDASRILFDAAIGCLVVALLFRWFWTVLVDGVRQTILRRQSAAASAAKKTPTS